MNRIETTKKFDKQFSKLNPKLKQKFKERSVVLLTNPENPILNNHALVGIYRGYNSINVTGDLRALYFKKGNTVIIFAFIGTHSQLYA